MLKIIVRTALLGMMGLCVLGGPAAQETGADDPHATGLIPLDARQVERIVASWPRITRVGLNPLGYERVNAVRAGKGKPPLDPQIVRSTGGELESALAGRDASVLGAEANLELAGDLPVAVDNSQLRFFPPIRSQGSLGSCVSFASTYVQLSYMTAFQRNLDIRDNADNTNKYSPKWTYNMVNDGVNEGSSFFENYAILEKHGAATWADFPYDSNYLAWCLNPAAWRNALGARARVTQYVYDASTDVGLEQIKELLIDGYVVVYGTYISSWVFGTIQDDASTSDDDAAVGRAVCYWLNGTDGGHAMTIVGYNDAIWTDVNSNGSIDAGEKGALRIANSWGPGWHEGGFTWLAYDALRSTSAVPDGPSTGRTGAFQSDMVFVLTARNAYSPLVVGEFTLNHAKRNQLRLSLGRSATTTTVPTTSWTPSVIWSQGGAFAFDGSTTAVNGTFVLDFTDILAAGAGPQRYYLGVNDNAAGDPATLSAFKIVDLTTDPDTETVSTLVPQTADGQQIHAYADYTYAGPAYNDPPQLSSPQVDPASGTDGSTYTFTVRYADHDADVPTVKNVVLDGVAHAMALVSGQPPANGWYSFETMLPAGSHGYYFYFEDGHGESARAPLAGDANGPMVYGVLANALSPSSAAAGGAEFVLDVSGSFFESGAVVTWDGADRPTTFVSTTRLTAQIGAADIATGETVLVRVRNPGGLVSNSLSFTVNNPVPSLTSVSPASATGGGSAPALTLRGSNFVPSSVARLNGQNLATTYASPAQLQVSLTAQNVSAAGDFVVTVLNPAPAGGSSTGVSFMVSGFTVSATPTTVSATAGQAASGSIQVTPHYGPFEAAVSFRCMGLPRGCTASFSPSTVTPGATAGTAIMTLATTARGGSTGLLASEMSGPLPPAIGLILLLSALAAPALSRWTTRRRLAAAALILLTVWLAGCGAGGGGGSQDQGTPAGTYELLLEGTSGSLSALTSVTLIVH